MAKKMMMVSWMLIFSVLFSCFVLSQAFEPNANTKRITLLAVSENPDGNITGATADLFLEIKDGNGRVFIDTFPLTKLDTQISTRFAKEIACAFLKQNKAELGSTNCNEHDFIYTIKSDAPIIGGPSAGAAISLLTIFSLTGTKYDENIAMTGTINSGGLVGVVSGIRYKIDAAADAKIKKVIIPAGTRFSKEDNGTEIDLKKYAEDKGIELVEAADLNEAIFQFTGKELIASDQELVVNEKYMNIMKTISKSLCDRSNELLNKLNTKITKKEADALHKTDEQLNKSEQAYKSKKYYSSASYCFGSNVNLNAIYLMQLSMSYDDALAYLKILDAKLQDLEKDIDSRKIISISDLQTYMVIKDRIVEAKDIMGSIRSAPKQTANKNASVKNPETDYEANDYIYNLAFAEERLNSAVIWAAFFDSNISEKEIFSDDKEVEKLCNEKIEEAQERIQYLAFALPLDLGEIKKGIDYAMADRANKDYKLCLFKALKAKAEANSILHVMNINDDFINKSMEIKLSIVKNNIITEIQNDMFPIVGYSYYEYADELKNTDIGSALLYAEYALELSNFHVYLDDGSQNWADIRIFNHDNLLYITIFFIGLVVGLSYNLKITKKR